MSLADEMKAEPWRFDFYSALRQIERDNAQKPRIGDSAARREEYLDLGQDPYLEFPASNLASVAERDGRLKIIVRFLGMLGPQGALPLQTTDESLGWLLMRDDAFPRFLDLFNNRFLQLFFRAWSNSRPIGQHDRPAEDRFFAYIGSFVGLGSKPYSNLDSIPDIVKLEYAGLLAPKAKSASRLGRLLRIPRFHAHDLSLKSCLTAYMRRGIGPKQRLRSTKAGDARLEQAYATHFVWPGKEPFHRFVSKQGSP